MHLAPLDVQLNTLNAYRKVERLGVIYNEREQNSVLNVKGLGALTGERGMRLLAAPVPVGGDGQPDGAAIRSEEHTSELQSLMRNSYAVFCLKKKQHHSS